MKRFARIFALTLPIAGIAGLAHAEPASGADTSSDVSVTVETSSVSGEPFPIDLPQSMNLSSREMNALRLGTESEDGAED